MRDQQGDVGQHHDEHQPEGHGRANDAHDGRQAHDRDPQGDRSGECDHLAVQADPPCDHSGKAEQHSQVEDVGADDHTSTERCLAVSQGCDGGGDVSWVSREGGQ
jgi:hypothetical protein